LRGALPLAAGASLAALLLAAAPLRPAWQWDDARRVAHGRAVYMEACASCHGADMAGQPNWWRPGVDGMLPAPPHDASGHTWQHSDRELTELIAHGVAAFAPAGYRSAMPAFAGRLSARDIRDTIAFIKSTWPPGQRAWQATRNPGGPSLAALPGDWVFPNTCGYRLAP
jgi:mono/diheme cytochrome c family protein